MNEPLRLVLDTNVVIDWLVFDHPYMLPLRAAAASTVRVLTHELAVEELTRVLAYPLLRLTEQRQREVLDAYLRQTQVVEVPDGFASNDWLLPASFPSCRDRDDDLFLALAYHSQAAALVTRDKLLLKMRKRVRKYGVSIWDVPQLIAALAGMPAASASMR